MTNYVRLEGKVENRSGKRGGQEIGNTTGYRNLYVTLKCMDFILLSMGWVGMGMGVWQSYLFFRKIIMPSM